MRIGGLDRRIVIETRTDAQDAHGAPVPSWSTLATVWARKDDRGGVERFKAAQPSVEIETVFTIRWRSDVTELMRISYDGTYYDIAAITEGPGRKQTLVLGCKSR